MPDMATSKKKPPPVEKKPARIRTGYNINAWVDAEIGRALEAYIAGTQPEPTKLSALEHVLRTGLQQLGKWPPR